MTMGKAVDMINNVDTAEPIAGYLTMQFCHIL